MNNPNELRDELLGMADQDQAVRRALERMRTVDERNTERLKQIVADHGWPGRSVVGDEAAEAAWLIAQHSADRTFMSECLPTPSSGGRGGGSVGAQSRILGGSRADDGW